MRLFILLSMLVFTTSCVSVDQPKQTKEYPSRWWSDIPKNKKRSWEISPASVKPPVVVISKRNELGVLSNFAATPFSYNEKKYASIEGLWQSTKFPDPQDIKDPRHKIKGWPFTREQVEQMTAFKAKRAGKVASKLMQKHKINWVSFNGERMSYRENKKGRFYELIRGAMEAKVSQNKKVAKVLESTGNLILVPDHRQGKKAPPAWKYHEIYMEIRLARRMGSGDAP